MCDVTSTCSLHVSSASVSTCPSTLTMRLLPYLPHTGLSLLTSLHTLELCCIASSSSSPPSLVAEELDPDTA